MELIDEINELYRNYLNTKIPMIENKINVQREIIKNNKNRVVDVEYAKQKLKTLERELAEVKGFKEGVSATREILLRMK